MVITEIVAANPIEIKYICEITASARIPQLSTVEVQAMLGETPNLDMKPSKRMKDEPLTLSEPLGDSSSVDDSAERDPSKVITETMQQEEQRMHQESERDYQRRLRQMVISQSHKGLSWVRGWMQ